METDGSCPPGLGPLLNCGLEGGPLDGGRSLGLVVELVLVVVRKDDRGRDADRCGLLLRPRVRGVEDDAPPEVSLEDWSGSLDL